MPEEKDNNIDSTNIFDEFSGDKKIKEEVKNIEEQKRKNIGYYIGIISNFLSIVNLIIFLGFLIIGIYFYIQNNKTIDNASYLKPVCNLFIGKKGSNNSCFSVSYGIDKYEKENSKIKNIYYKQNLFLLESILKNLNFIDSKEVSFLINKSRDRLKVLEMLSEFDRIKNAFSPLNKTILKCDNIKITSDFTMDVSCSAYSGDWDSNILGFSGQNKGEDKVNGTSISIASSFINFIEKIKPEPGKSQFFIEKKPKKFSFVEIVNSDGYTRKTNFKLKLKYKNNILLPKK